MHSRRDFLKISAFLGAGAVVSLYGAEIKRVFAQSAESNAGKIHMIWLLLAGDSGCTISMLQASNPDLIESVESLGISADYWQTFMTPDYDLGWVSAGYTTENNSQVPLMNTAFGNAPVDLLVVEGAPQVGTPNTKSEGDYCVIGEYNGASVNGYQLLQKLASKAGHVIAIGQCSSFGGIPAGKGNLTGAVSVTDALKKAGVTTKNPVVNIPGCPAQPDWVLITLASVLQGFTPELDDMNRPKAFFSGVIHDNCPRRGAYDRGDFATTFDDPVGCYWNLGCKGPITQSSCALTRWNNGVGFCTENGPMCWGCMHPSFPDPPSSPFFEQVSLTPSFLGLTVDEYAELVALGSIIAVGAHLTRKVVTKEEEEKEAKKGMKPIVEEPPV